MYHRNETSYKDKVGVSQNSNYPESIEDSRYKIYERPYLNQLQKNQQQMVNQYLNNAHNKSKKQLITQRDDLLQELHLINNHLSEMIDQLYGTINSLQHQPDNNNLYEFQSSPKQTNINNESKISKRYNKLQQSSIQSTPQSSKKDELKNLNSNQLDALSQKNNKQMISLQQQIQDYQFMLTGEYWDRLDQQIQKQTSYKKQLQQEITFLTKTIHKHTKSYDKQIISKLQKSFYDKQVQLTLLNKKLQSKQNKLQAIENQSKQKKSKIRKLQQQEISLNNMLEMYEDEEFEGIQSGKIKKDYFQKLFVKKQKLQKVINSLNSNNLKMYNKKLSEFRSLHQKIQQYHKLAKRIDENILLLVKQRKDFQQKNKYLLNKVAMLSSLQNQFLYEKSQQKISQSRYQPSQINGSFTTKNRLKTLSQHTYQNNQPNDYHSKNKKSDFTHQSTIQPKEQNSQRRRVYTQLQNSHYFSSMERKYRRQQRSPIQQYVTPKNQSNERVNFRKSIIQQKKFNSSVNNVPKIDERIKMRNRNQIRGTNERIDRKGDSIQREVENGDQIQQRLRKLQEFLRKDQINLNALKKIQQKLYSSKSKKIQPYHDQTYITESSRNSSLKQSSKNTQRSQQKHYKELCDRLGKNRLLIEEDVDISGLIYQGMSGKR